jgi:cytochrome c biogenesis protein CcdA
MDISFKNLFAYLYQRFTWGSTIIRSPLGLFNSIGILAILFGDKIKSYDFIFYALIIGGIVFILSGIFFYDILKIKTNLIKHEGKNNEYWVHKLTPLQQKTQFMLLDCIENKNNIKKYKSKIKKGFL